VVLGVLQSKAKPLLFAIAAVGVVLSNVMVAVAAEVQPFEAVTVTVKIPAVLTVVAAVVAPFDHR
jgi:hypothetical protein